MAYENRYRYLMLLGMGRLTTDGNDSFKMYDKPNDGQHYRGNYAHLPDIIIGNPDSYAETRDSLENGEKL